jgi:hypothetical protein
MGGGVPHVGADDPNPSTTVTFQHPRNGGSESGGQWQTSPAFPEGGDCVVHHSLKAQ